MLILVLMLMYNQLATELGAIYSVPLSLPGFDQEGFHHEESEDCLTLNIWRPDGKKAQRNESLPVLVWLYGGGLTAGYTVGKASDRSHLADLVTD